MSFNIFLTLFGLTILTFAANILLRGAVGLALILHISKAVVGLTIVAMGTSMPELMVSLKAAFKGSSDLAYGNVLGSNIMNIGAILGICALIRPVKGALASLKVDWPVMFLGLGLAVVFSLNGMVSRVEGLVLFGLMVAFLAYQVLQAKKHPESVLDIEEIEAQADDALLKGQRGIIFASVFIIGGILGLNYGSEWFVQGAVGIAQYFGVSERVIGLTIVAIGTSAPEFFTSLMATLKKENDIAINNVIGSNIFNILGVLGLTASIYPISVQRGFIEFDNLVCLAISFLLFVVLFKNKQISRWGGGLLLIAYLAYLFYLF